MSESALPQPDPDLEVWLKSLRERAFRLLARREHSRKELGDKLLTPPNSPTRHRLPSAPAEMSRAQQEAEVETLLDKLEANNLLSDQRFADNLTRQYLRKGKGLLALQQAYQQHQLATEITRPLLDWLAPLWEEQAWRVRSKRFGEAPPADAREAAKMQRFLASRGFTPEQIRQAVFD
ncbi:regulatory protein RecX [Marinospirillum perlucidum]|uniref:regulatory protein RecX n=1 Tax=Marinospirillum perlucidum TaxID=1982602 RepID=UPI000DF40E38|nr:regulatory protein RecX [Marinospirillum perlucidum]